MEVFPVEYWSNTSSNSIIRDLIVRAGSSVRNELEELIGGGSIEKVIHEDITYQDIYESEENLWNFLFFTGYLKAVDVKLADDDRVAVLQIPNREVRKIYRQQIIRWMKQTLQTKDLSGVFEAAIAGDADRLQEELAPFFANSISYMDNYENFYHGFLLGLFARLDGYKVTSNREAGDGRYDISLESLDGRNEPVIIELKIAVKKKDLERAAKIALEQILQKRYDAPFREEGYLQCIHIGIGFYKKMCWVECEKVKF